MTRSPRIIAHRGASREAPENTFASFQRAIDLGADGIEFDIQLAKDGVPVVIHDSDLKRTGLREGNVSEMTSLELANVDVGTWFDRKFPRIKKNHSGERIRSLGDTLELLKNFNGSIFIELKCDRRVVEPLVLAASNLVATTRLSWQVIVKGFNPSIVPLVKMVAPNIRAYSLFDISITNILRRKDLVSDLSFQLGADGMSLHKGLINKTLIAKAEKLGLPVAAWTIDDTKWLQRSIDLGISDIITNDPAKFLSKHAPAA